MPFDAVIFDLDDTIVHSQPLQYEAYHKAFAECGFVMSEADWKLATQKGHGPRGIIKQYNWDVDLEDVRARKKAYYEDLIRTDLQLMPGALVLINRLHGHYPLAVASSSRMDSIVACLGKFELLDVFPWVVSGRKEHDGIPTPETFLACAKKIGKEPAKCIVIEDSPVGLMAAKAAGMTCIVCPDADTPASEYAEADFIVASLDDPQLRTILPTP